MNFHKIGQLPEFVCGECKGSQAPCCDLLNDETIRVYFSSRDKLNRSFPFYCDVKSSNPLHIINNCELPILSLGPPGEFDDSGVMVSQIENNIIYYVGWNISSSEARYRTSIGKALKTNDIWHKCDCNPVLDRNNQDKIGVSMPFVTDLTGDTTMFYMSYTKWEKSEPSYEIRARHHSYVEKKLCLTNYCGGLARPVVFKTDGVYLICCKRDAYDYRNNKNHSYKLRLYELINCTWNETDISIINSDDDLMQAYGFPCHTKYGTYLFYNNNFTSPLQVAILVNELQ